MSPPEASQRQADKPKPPREASRGLADAPKPPPESTAATYRPADAGKLTPLYDATRLDPSTSQRDSHAVDYAGAKKQIELTIKTQPKDFDLRIKAAQFYMRAGDHVSAIPHLKAATKLSPMAVLPWIALGDAAALNRSFDVAATAYAHAAALDSRNPQVVRGRGQMFVLQRKWKEARRTLEEGVARFPRDAEIRTVLGNLYLILNKPRLVLTVLKPALEQQPDRADLHYMLGEAYARDLHIEAAIEQMREAARLEPNDPEAWGRIGLYENNLTRYKEAREPLQRAIALSPREAHYYWALGDSYLLESTDPANFDRAAQLYRKALSLNGTNEKALYSFGMALTRRGKAEDLKEAATLFETLVRLKPVDMNAHYKLAEIYRRLGQDKLAAAEQAKFQALFAKGRNQTRRLYEAASFKDTVGAHLKLARRAAAANDYTLAATEFQLALDRDPNLAEAQRGLELAKKQSIAVGGTR